MTDEPFDNDAPVAPRDRREPGGMPLHPNDDELARRTERERVAAGLEPYDPDDVPPAADAALPYDPDYDRVAQDIAGVTARQESELEHRPLTEDNPFPPTRYRAE
jgi:hypothetical protein